MSYNSSGFKPYERASKSAHHHIINDDAVIIALKNLYVPPRLEEGTLSSLLIPFEPKQTDIEHIIAIDGGYTEVPIREGYPAATIHFFQFGALYFKLEDLILLERSQHIAPEDMQKLKNIERLKLPLETRGARKKECFSIKDSIRKSIYDFLLRETLGEESCLMETLAWFTFRQYKKSKNSEDSIWEIGSNPYGNYGKIVLNEREMSKDYMFVCPETGKDIYLSDIFRLHEGIEEETGASGIAAYVAGLIEHLVLLHLIRNLMRKNKETVKHVLFIMDRPTGWFGFTATVHKLMLELNNWLMKYHDLFLVGLEKSGAFVEHAKEIKDVMPPGTVLILDDSYIYRYISPGEESPDRPYASTSYYGHKVIFKSRQGQMYVVSMPVKELKKSPTSSDIPNLHEVLTHIEQLHCDMFENALLPVALANKLVSLSAHPSSQILKTFAKASIAS